MSTHTDRVVVLVDMDCFYCQVEEKLNPALAGRPIAVVQYNQWRGGGLIAVNYPARDKGVTRHMRGNDAKEMCPEIELVSVPTVRGKADLTKYREGGKRVAEVLQTFTPLLQRASVDEAYLDITEAVINRLNNMDRKVTLENVAHTYVVGCEIQDFISNVYQNEFYNDNNLKLLIGGMIVEEIRAAVYEKTGYRCSAGIAHNKILAKLVCGMNKPNKQTILPHDGVEELYKTLSVTKIKSLGGKFGNSLLEDLNIKYMADLAKFSEKELQKRYDDKTALFLYNIARGIDLEPVEVRLISKSIGCCKKFPGKTALIKVEDVIHWISDLSEEMSERLEQDLHENNRKAKQIVLSFAQEINKKDIHSSRTQNLNSYEAKKISDEIFESLKRFTQKPDGSFHIKFLGLSAGKFEDVKNVTNITSFFKQINKKETITEPINDYTPTNEDDKTNKQENDKENQDIDKENHQKPKIKDGMMYFFTIGETNKTDPFLSSKPKKGKSEKKNSIMNFLNKPEKEEFLTNNKKNTNTKININNIKPKTNINESDLFNKSMSEELNDSNKIEDSVDNNQTNELNISDIENDAENSIDVPDILLNRSLSEDVYLNSTTEMDYTETLVNKTEFPYKNGFFTENSFQNDLISNENLSPILDHESRDTSKSFFMNYIKNMENSSESQKTIKYNENLYKENALKSLEQLKTSPVQCYSKLEIEKNIEPVACSSKSEQNFEDSSISEDSQNNLQIEVVFSDNSCSMDETEIFNLYDSCPECNEKILKTQLVSHLDHHVALRLMEEEKKIFREEFEKDKQKRLQTVKPLTKSDTAKRKKRKLNEPVNNKKISTFFKQQNESSSSKPCPECGKLIESSELTNHFDFHTAKKLHLKLNPVKFGTNPVNITKSTKKKVLNNIQSVSNFFKPV